MELEATGHQMMPMAAMVSSEGHVSPQMPGQPQALHTPVRAPPPPRPALVSPWPMESTLATDAASATAAPSPALPAEQLTLAKEVKSAKGDRAAALVVKNKLILQKDVRIEFKAGHSKRGDSGVRYEAYKKAQTIADYKELNPDKKAGGDLWFDIQHGYVRVLEEGEMRQQTSAPVPLTREAELRMKCNLLGQRLKRMAVRPLAHLHELTHEKRRARRWLAEFESSEEGTVESSITDSIMTPCLDELLPFLPSEAYDGRRDGYYFGTGPRGTGYYLDEVSDYGCLEEKHYGTYVWKESLSRCEKIIDALSALGYMLDIGITSQPPQKRLSNKENYTSYSEKKRMIVLFYVAADAKTLVYTRKSGEEKTAPLAKLAESHLQDYAFREHHDNLSNDKDSAGKGGKFEKRNLIYVVYWEPPTTRTVRWERKSKDDQQDPQESTHMEVDVDSNRDTAAAAAAAEAGRQQNLEDTGSPAAKRACTGDALRCPPNSPVRFG